MTVHTSSRAWIRGSSRMKQSLPHPSMVRRRESIESEQKTAGEWNVRLMPLGIV